MSFSPLKFYASQTIPLEANTIAIDPSGELSRRPLGVINFGFQYGPAKFSAKAYRDETYGALLISGDLGVLPFTAEGHNRRIDAIAAVRTLEFKHAPNLRITENFRVLVEDQLQLTLPLSPAVIIAGVTELILHMRGLINFLAMLGLGQQATITHRTAA